MAGPGPTGLASGGEIEQREQLVPSMTVSRSYLAYRGLAALWRAFEHGGR